MLPMQTYDARQEFLSKGPGGMASMKEAETKEKSDTACSEAVIKPSEDIKEQVDMKDNNSQVVHRRHKLETDPNKEEMVRDILNYFRIEDVDFFLRIINHHQSGDQRKF